MILAIDVGNSHTVLGLFEGERLTQQWRVSTREPRTEDEFWILYKTLCEDKGVSLDIIEGAVIASVVPDCTGPVVDALRKHAHIDPLVIESSLQLGMQIHYENPQSVGADRLCNAIAARDLYGSPAIIVDLGTATTFDVIDEQGNYMGGIICPGLEMSAVLLHARAAKLPMVELKFPDKLIGQDTECSIQAGIMFGAVEQIDGLVRHLMAELDSDIKVVATGGLASIIAERSETIDLVDHYLTLQGLRIIHQRIRGG